MKIKELHQKLTESQRHLISNNFSGYDFLEDYFQTGNSDILDFFIMEKTFPDLIVDDDVAANLAYLDINVSAVLTLNKFKYSEIYKTLGLEYNPLWNVDGTEVTEYSDHITDNEYGKKEASTTVGAQNNDSTASVYNTGGGQKNTDKTVSNIGERTDSSSAEAYTDVTTSEAHTVTVTRQGNIGVTETTKLLSDQQDYVSISFLKMVLSDIIIAISKRVYD